MIAFRLTVISSSETVSCAALVAILVHHDAEDEIKLLLIRNDRSNSIAHFAFLDAVAAPAVFAHTPNRYVNRDRKPFVTLEIVVECAKRRPVDLSRVSGFGRLSGVCGEFGDSPKILGIGERALTPLRDQFVE